MATGEGTGGRKAGQSVVLGDETVPQQSHPCRMTAKTAEAKLCIMGAVDSLVGGGLVCVLVRKRKYIKLSTKVRIKLWRF